jgi:hypothetical protein
LARPAALLLALRDFPNIVHCDLAIIGHMVRATAPARVLTMARQ